MSPALNGSFVLQHFERGNAIEIRNGIMFDFYPGLPHIGILESDYISMTTEILIVDIGAFPNGQCIN